MARSWLAARLFLFLHISRNVLSSVTTCNKFDYASVNASDHVNIAGFVVNESNPSPTNNTWKLSTGVSEHFYSSSNTTLVEQSFWLDSPAKPVANLSELPYWGCLIVLQGIKPALSSSNNSVTCSGVLSSTCYSSIVHTVNEAAYGWDDAEANIAQVCHSISSQLAQNIGSACDDSSWTSNVTAVPFGDMPGQPNSCDISVFSGSKSYTALLSQTFDASTSTNFTAYDDVVMQSTPVILTAFKKQGATTGSRWVDSRLVCLMPRNIKRGSRVPTNGTSMRFSPPGKFWFLVTMVVALAYNTAAYS